MSEIPESISLYFHYHYVISWDELLFSSWGYTREDQKKYFDNMISHYLMNKIFEVFGYEK